MSKRIRLSYLLLFVVFAALVIVAACKKDKPSYQANYQYDYYPIDSGHYVIYHVDSVLYNFNDPVYTRDTFSYDWKVQIGDTFYDNQNQLCYKLDCYRRADSTQAWSFDREWYTKRTTTNLQVVEDDIRFIKLIFPPQLNATWNGNLYVPTTPPYDAFLNWNYNYANVDTAFVLNGVTYNHALVVSEVNNENYLAKTLRREAYVEGIGMIYQEWENLGKQTVDSDWITGPQNGFRIRMKAIGHNP
jgi:hypothetical protein